MSTKLKKIPLLNETIRVRRTDASAQLVMMAVESFYFRKELTLEQLGSRIDAALTNAVEGERYADVPFPYKDAMLDALDSPPMDDRGQPRGFGPREQRKRNKVVAIIEAAEDGFVLLEDADYHELKAAVNALNFRWRSEGIEQFVDAIENAEEVEVEPKSDRTEEEGDKMKKEEKKTKGKREK